MGTTGRDCIYVLITLSSHPLVVSRNKAINYKSDPSRSLSRGAKHRETRFVSYNSPRASLLYRQMLNAREAPLFLIFAAFLLSARSFFRSPFLRSHPRHSRVCHIFKTPVARVLAPRYPPIMVRFLMNFYAAASRY